MARAILEMEGSYFVKLTKDHSQECVAVPSKDEIKISGSVVLDLSTIKNNRSIKQKHLININIDSGDRIGSFNFLSILSIRHNFNLFH